MSTEIKKPPNLISFGNNSENNNLKKRMEPQQNVFILLQPLFFEKNSTVQEIFGITYEIKIQTRFKILTFVHNKTNIFYLFFIFSVNIELVLLEFIYFIQFYITAIIFIINKFTKRRKRKK